MRDVTYNETPNAARARTAAIWEPALELLNVLRLAVYSNVARIVEVDASNATLHGASPVVQHEVDVQIHRVTTTFVWDAHSANSAAFPGTCSHRRLTSVIHSG